jgi:hypothetical protein
MGWARSTHRREQKRFQNFGIFYQTWREMRPPLRRPRRYWEDSTKLILKILDSRVWSGFMWLLIGFSDGLLLTQEWIFIPNSVEEPTWIIEEEREDIINMDFMVVLYGGEIGGIGVGPRPMANCITKGVEPPWAFPQSVIYFPVLILARTQTVVFWVVTTCSLGCGHRRFGGTFCLYLQDDSQCV